MMGLQFAPQWHVTVTAYLLLSPTTFPKRVVLRPLKMI